MEKFTVDSNNREEVIDITNMVLTLVNKSEIREGICYLYVPHTTAGIFINENYDPDVKKDILKKLSDIVPFNESYSHVEGNADSHIKSSLIGNSINVLINDSKLVLGKWQGVFFAEFDGPRKREVYIKIK